jgi:hypothetical protein
VIVDDLELADVAVLHHDGQEAGDHLRRGAKQNLNNKIAIVNVTFCLKYYLFAIAACSKAFSNSS